MSLFVDLLVHEPTQLYSMVGCIWQELVELLLYARSKEWMTVQGIACVVYTDKERKRLDLVEVMIVYMYRFQGKPYTGSITRTPVAHPNRMIGRFPHKAPVMVHVNPSY